MVNTVKLKRTLIKLLIAYLYCTTTPCIFAECNGVAILEYSSRARFPNKRQCHNLKYISSSDFCYTGLKNFKSILQLISDSQQNFCLNMELHLTNALKLQLENTILRTVQYHHQKIFNYLIRGNPAIRTVLSCVGIW